MKIKGFMACIVFILSATAVQAGAVQKTGSPGYDSVIKDFIESHMKTNHKKLKLILEDGAQIKIPRGETVIVQNKHDVVEQAQQDEGVQQVCGFSYEVLGKSDAIVIARVDFKYENCIQHNYLTLEKNEDKEWKITQDCKIFDDIQPPPDRGGSITLVN